jgi:hypothetical protein
MRMRSLPGSRSFTRGGRKGFRPEVESELLALRTHFDHVQPL